MNCSLCGRENRESAKFCDSCGATLDPTIARLSDDPLFAVVRAAFAERYYIDSLLGRGGMGYVYKARERSLDRYVALKVVPQERNHDVEFIERFRREAKIAAGLRHPRIVSVHEVGNLGGFHYFSMDYIDGATLREVVERRTSLPPEDAVSIATEICRAVAHAHAKGIIHRDLKPENVMIDSEGDVFVMDFGLARAMQERTLTQSGVILGSPFYMSPEQLIGDPLDERTDIYSMGLILYYALTGEDLFAADSITAIVARHMTTRISDIVHPRPLPPNLKELLIAMLEEDRDQRARTAKEILERLTLRKIVALGMAATGDSDAKTLRIEDREGTTVEQPAAPSQDTPVAAAAARRKARLRSLLDEM